ncbi:MAG: esterase-like activity of phytase family protein [Candidatus Binatia bacterium]
MRQRARHRLTFAALAIVCALMSGQNRGAAQPTKGRLVELIGFDLDPKNPDRKQFGPLTFMGAFQLNSKDKRFGGLSGLTIGADGRLYAVSDRGYWLSARMLQNAEGALVDLVDGHIAAMLTPAKIPVTGSLSDAEALARAQDGSFLVAFEGRHRIWRYDPPPHTFESTPTPIAVPAELSRAPSNGGIEGLATLPDGRLLALTEEFANPDGSFKGWLLNGGHFAELSYLPAKGFRVTDCAALKNGDVLVLERRYVPFGILSARVTLVDGKTVRPGATLSGRELLKLEQPLVTENFEGLAVQDTAKGTMIYLISDDNYNPFQQTLLLQFLLPDRDN